MSTHSATKPSLAAPWRNFLIGRSPAMERLAEKIELIGPKRATILITGETGTGKEVTARAIHAAGPRGRHPMVAVNCTALPESLLEAELFGHVRGAFTGAVQNRAGRFEQAHNSTLFLDEIGDMPLAVQSKLLRVLQEREFQRLGSSETTNVDVRVVAATNVDLAERVRQGRFREDLYYRLSVVPLALPPLRERREDIEILAAHFVARVAMREAIPAPALSRAAIEHLVSFDWPGNIRQLENTIEQAIALSGESRVLTPRDFPLPASGGSPHAGTPPARAALPVDVPLIRLPEEGLDFEQTVGRIELHLLEQALRRAGGNKSAAADMLRLKRTTLTAKLKSLSRTVGAL